MNAECQIHSEQIVADLTHLTFFEELLTAHLAQPPYPQPCPDYENATTHR